LGAARDEGDIGARLRQRRTESTNDASGADEAIRMESPSLIKA
jgi:hypothetical protein